MSCFSLLFDLTCCFYLRGVTVKYIFCNVWPIVNNCKWGPSETINKYGVGDVLHWTWEDSKLNILMRTTEIENIIDKKNFISEEIRNLVRKNHQ